MEFICCWEDCSSQFSDEDVFFQHVAGHLDDRHTCRWRGCRKYGYSNNNKCTMLAHVRKHTGEKPFFCKECAKSYTRGDTLAKHTKSHTKKNIESAHNRMVLQYLRRENEVYELFCSILQQKRAALEFYKNFLLLKFCEQKALREKYRQDVNACFQI